MRIQLTIERNGLPTTNILWPVNVQENGMRTIVSSLLAKVDEAIPLETDEWSMEDYIVQVNGFECLHYQNLSDLLKEDDRVTIRPLQSDEVKARYMLGRNQIDTNLGVHLHDGVPFGKPCLRKPIRPKVKIPPRKRRRIDFENDETTDTTGPGPEGQLLIEHVDESEEQLALLNGGFATLREQATYTRPAESRKPGNTVRFVDVPDLAQSEDDDDEDDGDFGMSEADSEELESGDSSDDSSDSSSDVSSSNSDPDSESSSDSSSGSSSASESDTRKIARLQSPWVNGITKANGEASKSCVQATGKAPVIDAPPGEGSQLTRSRNRRRHAHNQLTKLKQLGALPPTAKHDDLRIWREANPGRRWVPHNPSETQNTTSKTVASSSKFLVPSQYNGESRQEFSEASNATIAEPVAPTTNGVTNGHTPSKVIDDFEETVMKDREEFPEEMSSREPVFTGIDLPAVVSEPTESSAKRARLNLAGAQRHIFGSLGVRTPKSKDDAEKTRARLVEQVTPKKVLAQTADVAVTHVEEELPESDAWRNKIRLLAVECCEGGIELSEPPYPFYQRWDPQQQYQKSGANYARKRKRKDKRKYGQQAFEEEQGEWYYDEYTGDNSLLNYDEDDTLAATDPADKKSNSSEYNGEIENRLLNDIRIAFSSRGFPSRADLPALPDEMSTLPDARTEDFVSGAIIAFKQLEMSEATNWAPVISNFVTAEVVERVDTSVVQIKLAIRDREVSTAKYDDEGNRVYAKFEMAGISDAESGGEEEEDDGIRELSIAEMIETKLVRANEDTDVNGGLLDDVLA